MDSLNPNRYICISGRENRALVSDFDVTDGNAMSSTSLQFQFCIGSKSKSDFFREIEKKMAMKNTVKQFPANVLNV